MKITLCATLRANPISWVTTSIVMPSRASATMTSRTSLIISGSSADVGSSKSMIFGCIASARAMATRCCWPPESCAGYAPALSGMSTLARRSIASRSASARSRPRTRMGARTTFSSAVM